MGCKTAVASLLCCQIVSFAVQGFSRQPLSQRWQQHNTIERRRSTALFGTKRLDGIRLATTATSTESSKQEEIVSDDSPPHEIVDAWLESFTGALSSSSPHKVADLFISDAAPFWRDMVAFSWNIITLEGKEAIKDLVESESIPKDVTMTIADDPLPLKHDDIDLDDNNSKHSIEVWCDLTTSVGTGKAFVRLERHISSNSTWKAQRLLTVLTELKDHPFMVGENRIRGAIHGPTPNRKYWSERLQQREPQSNKDSSLSDNDDDNKLDYFTVIIGGGQAGLSLGAQLQLLGVDYVVLESADQPGAAWRRRYPSLHLHDPVWYNHMPYLPFPSSWPIFCPRDKIADWLEQYAKTMDIDVQTQTKVVSARQVSSDGSSITEPFWEIDIETRAAIMTDNEKQQLPGSVKRTLRVRHVVFATGNSSHPRIPSLPGANKFRGMTLHSSKYFGGRPYKGKRVVVAGANNSALDICQDLWEQGAKSVTMIQRSPSLVVSTDSVLEHGLGPLYNEKPRLHHEEADLVATSIPFKQLMDRWTAATNKMRETDEDMHIGLAKAGYRLDFGPDGTGLFAKSATEGGGFYINMGAAELIIDGSIVIKDGTVKCIEEDGVRVVTGAEEESLLPADVLVYATGFDSLDQWVAEICGDEVAERVGTTWGLGWGRRPHKDPGPWQGELRNMWKPTQVDGLWFQGGNLAQSRYYSKLLGLQLAARYFGVETPVIGIPEATSSVSYRNKKDNE